MVDIFSKTKRSQIMSNVKSKNSKAELLVFSFLTREKIYYQKHYDKVLGKPDVAQPRRKKAVFIDGDFWHGRKGVKVTNSTFWRAKIEANKKRDKYINNELANRGWKILRIWEKDLLSKRTQSSELEKIRSFLS